MVNGRVPEKSSQRLIRILKPDPRTILLLDIKELRAGKQENIRRWDVRES